MNNLNIRSHKNFQVRVIEEPQTKSSDTFWGKIKVFSGIKEIEEGIQNIRQGNYKSGLEGVTSGSIRMAIITALAIFFFQDNSSKQGDIPNMHFKGSQHGCSGPADGQKIFQTLKSLPSPFIDFKEEYFNSTYVEGGTCTAMSLDIAAKIENICPPKKAKNAFQFSQCIEEIAFNYASSKQIFRDRQSAFNSITVSPSAPDTAIAKVQALASYHSFIVNKAAPDLSIYEQDRDIYLKNFMDEVNRIPSGTYFIRNLKLADNQKLEEYGHSTVLIKSELGSFYYDPNNGVRTLTNVNIGREVLDFLNRDMNVLDLNQPRLYHLSCDPTCTNVAI